MSETLTKDDLSALARELHAEIMNLPCKPGELTDCEYDMGYAKGHKESRHAAAELILSRLSPAAGVDALYPDNLNADLAHRLSCVAHDCCVNGRMRHDVGLKLVQVVRDFMRPVHSPAAPEGELIERASMTHGCKNCGEERPPKVHNGRLCCPECWSYNLVCLDEPGDELG